MPITLSLLAAGLVATALLGPLGLGVLVWRVSPSGLMQLYGAHIAELVLVVPATLAAAWRWRRGPRVAPALALGAAVYALYVSVQFVLFPDYTLYAGNNERFFPLFLPIVILAWVVAVRAWAALDSAAPAPPRWLARTFTVVVLATNGLIGLTWTAQVLGIAIGGMLPPGYADAPAGFWLIRLVDLGAVVPLSVATAAGVWRGQALANKAAAGVASFLTLEVGAVLAMGVAQLWLRDPAASTVLVAALAPAFLALAGTTGLLLRRRRSASSYRPPRSQRYQCNPSRTIRTLSAAATAPFRVPAHGGGSARASTPAIARSR
jgi:hypothetical protein